MYLLETRTICSYAPTIILRYLNNSEGRVRFPGLHSLQLLTLKPLDAIQNSLDGFLGFYFVFSGQNKLLNSLCWFKAFAVEASNAYCNNENEMYEDKGNNIYSFIIYSSIHLSIYVIFKLFTT